MDLSAGAVASGRGSIARLLRDFLTASPGVLFWTVGGSVGVVVSALGQLAMPLAIGEIVDAGAGANVDHLSLATGALVVAAAFCAVGGAAKRVAFTRVGDVLRTFLRTSLLVHMGRTILSRVEGEPARIWNAVFVEDVRELAEIPGTHFAGFVSGVTQSVGLLVVLTTRYDDLMWIAFAALPLNLALARWQLPFIRRGAAHLREMKGTTERLVREAVDAPREIRQYDQGAWIARKVESADAREQAARLRFSIASTVEDGRYALTWTVLAITYYFGVMAVIRGQLSIGGLTAFMWYVSFMDTPLTRMWAILTKWQMTRESLDRYIEAMNGPLESEGALALSIDDEPSVEFRGVRFDYSASASPALAAVSFKIRAGERVAVVGASGSGKTTMAALLLRLFEPQSGAVLVAGRDVRDYTLASLRRFVTCVFQEPYVFDASASENIGIGATASCTSAIDAAARVADVHDVVSGLPQGYETSLGVRGTKLSGGERRRLCVARAVLRKPRVLILDEVSGSIDCVSDRSIQSKVNRMGSQTTTIVISHRIASVQDADAIIVLERGKVAGIGTHDNLLEACSEYRRLCGLSLLRGNTTATGSGAGARETGDPRDSRAVI